MISRSAAMKSLLVLPLLLAAAAAKPLLGTEQCVHGPEVWCQNIQSAKQCGAVEHCQQNIWNKPTAKSRTCDFCKEIITVIDNLLKENTTEPKILSYLDKACELVPEQSLAAQCKEMVDAYFPEVFNIIKQELDNPGVACSAIGLCHSLQHQLGEEKHEQLQTNEIPEMDLSQDASPFIANLPLLLYPQDKPQERNGDVCQDCVQLFTDIITAVKTNSSFVSDYVEHLKKQCSLLPGEVGEQCKDYIAQYSDMAVQILIQMEDKKPTDICCMAGFCLEKESVPLQSLTPAKVIPAMKLVKAKLIPAMKLVKAMKMDVHEAAVHDQNPITCEVCQLVIGQVLKIVESNKTEDNIKHALEKVCSLLPSHYADQCNDFVETYFAALIQLLVSEADAKVICSALALCSNRPKIQNVMISPKQLESGQFCDTCKMIVMYLDKMLEKNSTQDQIKTALERVCNFLPPDMQKECDQYIEQYEPQLLELLLVVMEPTFVCTRLGACRSTEHLFGTDECTFGPSYWCKNMETATNCDAVEHCKRHIWN